MSRDDTLKEHIAAVETALNTSSKLYYGLWIVFLAGFAISLRAPEGLQCWQLTGLIVFRSLSIAGTCINFLMQLFAAKMLHNLKLWQIQADATEGDRSEAMLKWHEFGKISSRLENALMVVGAAYLLLGLVLSFFIHVPAN